MSEPRFEDLLAHPDFQEGVHWRRCRYEAGTAVFREGDTGREVYLILEGGVRVIGDVELDAARRVQPGLCDLARGALFGELALFDRGARSATVTAVEDTELAVIDGDRLLAFFEDNPDLGYRFLRELLTMVVGRMRATNRKLVSLFAWGLKAHGIEGHL